MDPTGARNTFSFLKEKLYQKKKPEPTVQETKYKKNGPYGSRTRSLVHRGKLKFVAMHACCHYTKGP